MGLANAIVSGVLRSPLHGVLSGSTALVRYTGRRTGRVLSTPTQYVRRADELVILVGRPDTKTWWRNFRDDRDIDVLVHGRWTPMTGHAVVGAQDPGLAADLLDAYLARFPRAARALAGDDPTSRARQAVLVWCRPRR